MVVKYKRHDSYSLSTTAERLSRKVAVCSMFVLLWFVSVILSVSSASASFIKPCPKNDQACAQASAQAAVPVFASGVPELGIRPLDPMRLALINGDQAGLQLSFRDTVVTGLKDCVIEGLKLDIDKGKMIVTVRCSVTLQGDYKLGGRLLVLPIQGEGKYTIKIQDIVIKTNNELETRTGADSKPHWHIKRSRHTYQVKTGTQFHFDNLFNGNKILAGPVQEFVNTNWRDVMKEVAPPIVRSIVDGVVGDVEALFKAVPAEELYIA